MKTNDRLDTEARRRAIPQTCVSQGAPPRTTWQLRLDRRLLNLPPQVLSRLRHAIDDHHFMLKPRELRPHANSPDSGD
jgi:hypothetical protein